MANTREDIARLEEEFKACRKFFQAVGDETRQHLICIMLEGPCAGERVVDIAKRTNLSRPAVSHHMQILKEAGLVKSRKEGTCVYYYLEPGAEEMRNLRAFMGDMWRIMQGVPEREGEE